MSQADCGYGFRESHRLRLVAQDGEDPIGQIPGEKTGRLTPSQVSKRVQAANRGPSARWLWHDGVDEVGAVRGTDSGDVIPTGTGDQRAVEAKSEPIPTG